MGGLFAAHLAMADRGGGYTGVLLILDHVFSIALVLGVFAIAAGVGARVLAAGGLTMDGPLEALLFRTAVGLAVLATAILGVGAFFGMRPVVLWALLGGAAVLVRREIGEVPPLVTGTLACLRARADRLSLFILLLVAVFLITGALAPPTDWDVLMYHLRVPKQFLQAGAIYRPEDNAHFAFVGLPHMLYLPLLALGTPEGPALVSALSTLGLALAGFAFGLRFLDDRTAGFSLALLWGSGMLLLVGISARTDTILGFYLFLVHYAVIRATQAEEPRFLYLAAALGGMAVGVKYYALIYLLALAPLGLWVVLTRLPQRAAALALMLGVAFVSALPWLLKNAVLLADPVYPYLSGPRLDPWLARIYGGAAVPPHVDPSAVWHTQLPFNVVDLFAAPARITVEGEGGAYRPNLLLLVLPLCLLFLKNRVLGWLAGPALAYVVLVVWLQPTTSLRYLIPAVAPLQQAGGAGLLAFGGHHARSREQGGDRVLCEPGPRPGPAPAGSPRSICPRVPHPDSCDRRVHVVRGARCGRYRPRPGAIADHRRLISMRLIRNEAKTVWAPRTMAVIPMTMPRTAMRGP